MSEDEGANPTAQGVPSEAEEASDDPAEWPTGERDQESDSGPQTGEEVREMLDRITEYDDELARDVNSIVETAQQLHDTVSAQQAELEDLRERIDEQADTIGDLQEDLEEREDELTAREDDLEDANERVEELEGALKHKQADFQNYKKRAKKRQEQLKKRATEDLVTRLVGVRDNLKRALGEESNDVDSLRDGLEMTLREFDRILEDENVEEVDPEPGTEVDPQRHEVMMTVDSALPEGTIEEVYRPGYEMAEKVIQNAQVTVSNGELEEQTEDTDEDDEHEGNTPEDVDEEDASNGDDAGDTDDASDCSESTDGEAEDDEAADRTA